MTLWLEKCRMCTNSKLSVFPTPKIQITCSSYQTQKENKQNKKLKKQPIMHRKTSREKNIPEVENRNYPTT